MFVADEHCDGPCYRPEERRRQIRDYVPPAVDHEAMTKLFFQRHCKRQDWTMLSDQLGIHQSGLISVGAARVPGEGTQRGYWLLPERDHLGNLIGLQRRFDDGTKLQLKGTSRGITISSCRDEPIGNTAVVVEGYTDTAAGASVGLWTIGRPSNTGGGEMIARLLQYAVQHSGYHIVVVGENDRKENGQWPGRDGAERVACTVANALGVEVWITFPPEGIKDLREWVQAMIPKHKGTTAAQRREVGEVILREMLSRVEVIKPDGEPLLPALQLPEVTPSYSDAVEELITAGMGSMPCPSHFVPLLQRRCDIHDYAALMVHCRRWTCPVCVHRRRSGWLTHLIQCYESATSLHSVEIAQSAWKALRMRLHRSKAHYVTFLRSSGQMVVIATAESPGSRAVTRFESADVTAECLCDLKTDTSKRCVNASSDWALRMIEDQPGEYLRRGQAPTGEFPLVIHRLERMGIDPTTNGTSKGGKTSWRFPEEMAEEQIEFALDVLQAERHETETPDEFNAWIIRDEDVAE